MLSDLANETIQHIAQHIEDEHDLYAICLTSCRLREAALPRLYENVNLESKGSQFAFLTSLKAHRELGSHVRTLCMEYWDEDNWDEDEDEDETNAGANEPAQAAELSDISDGQDETRRLTRFSMRELLDLMPKLEFASFCPCHNSSIVDSFRSCDSDSPSCLVAGLRNLTTLSLSWWDTENGFGIDVVLACQALPALRKLSVHTVWDSWDWDDEEGDDNESNEISGTSTVTDLTLEYWTVCSNRALTRVLGLPKALRSLSFSSDRLDGTAFAASAMLKGLRGSRETLQTLCISNEPNSLGFASLIDFTALTALEIQLSMLTSVSGEQTSTTFLPDSLESLILNLDSMDHADNWNAFVNMIWTRRPNGLKYLRVNRHHQMTQQEISRLQADLRDACRDIELVFAS